MKRKIDKANDLIRGELKRQKISQDKAAYYVGLSRGQFSVRLNGRQEWKIGELMQLAELLKIGGQISEILF